MARKPPPIKKRGDEALKFIAYIQKRIAENPFPSHPEAVFFEEEAQDLVKKSGSKITVTNAQNIMRKVFGLSTKGGELFDIFPNAKERAIELLNNGLPSKQVTDILEAEGLIWLRDRNTTGGYNSWRKAYKSLLNRGELKVDKIIKSQGTDLKIQAQKDKLVKEFLEKNPEIENPNQIAKAINMNTGSNLSNRFVKRSVERQNLNTKLISRHEAIFPEVKALDEVIKNSNDILLNEKIPLVSINGVAGTTNRGGGGGGGGWCSGGPTGPSPLNQSGDGGTGGSGIVIIRYKFQ